MTNEKKYQTQDERLIAFNKFCRNYRTCRDCPIFRGIDQIAKDCALYWLAMDGDKVAKPMPNTPTTPAFVASRLTDEEIERLARITEEDGVLYTEDEGDISAVLRDYVRMRRMNAELRKCVKDAVLQNCALCESKNTVACDTDGFCSERRWKKILADSEKGAAK